GGGDAQRQTASQTGNRTHRRRDRRDFLGVFQLPEFEQTLLGGLERANETAALQAAVPCFTQTCALVGVLQSKGRHGVFELGQRRIPDFFVAAVHVACVQSARLDQSERTGGEPGGAAVDVPILH